MPNRSTLYDSYFSVVFPKQYDVLSQRAHEVIIPTISASPAPASGRGYASLNLKGDTVTYDTLQITFTLDSSGVVFNSIVTWFNSIYNRDGDGGIVNPEGEKDVDIVVQLLDSVTLQPKIELKFEEVSPLVLPSFALSRESDGMAIQWPVEFSYFKFDYNIL